MSSEKSSIPNRENTDSTYPSQWEELISRLQNGGWIDERLVQAEWEAIVRPRLATNSTTPEFTTESPQDIHPRYSESEIKDLRLLTKLRLALIQAEIQSAPESFETPDACFVRNEHARDMMRFLDREIFPVPNDSIEVNESEKSDLYALITKFETKSHESIDRGHRWISVASRRTAHTHAKVFRSGKSPARIPEVLKASEAPCSGSPIREELLVRDWPLLVAAFRNSPALKIPN